MSAVPKRTPAAQPKRSPGTVDVFAVVGNSSKNEALIFQLAGKGGDWKVSGVPQLFAILLIQAETLALGRTPGSAPPLFSRPITLMEFAKKCGCTKEYSWRMLTDARKRGLLTWLSPKEAKALGLPPSAGHAQAFRFKLTPEKWATAPPYVPPEDEEQEETPEADEPEAEPMPPAAVLPPVELPAAGTSKPAAWPSGSKRYAFEAAETGLRIERRTEKDLILFTVHAANKELASGTVNLQVHSGKSSNRDAGAPSVGAVGLFKSHPAWKELATLLGAVATDKGPYPFYVDERQASALCSILTCPVAFYVERVTECVLRAQLKGKALTNGVLRGIAEESNAKWIPARERWEALHRPRRQEAKRAAPTRDEQIAELAASIDFVAHLPSHMETAATQREIAEARERDPELYAAAVRHPRLHRKRS